MAFKFGLKSKNKLAECHRDLQRVMELAISRSDIDFSITEGKREIETQAALFVQKKTRTMQSRHLACVWDGDRRVSGAVDIACFDKDGHIAWTSGLYSQVSKTIMACAKELKIDIRWGGDWDMDGDTKDQTFNDLVHFELWIKTYPADYSGFNFPKA